MHRCALRTVVVFGALLCCLLAAAPMASAADEGNLRLLPGDAGCWQNNGDGTNCADADGLHRASTVVTSPDGEHVYVAGLGGQQGSFAVFARSANGALSQVTCFNSGATDGCQSARGMYDPYAIAVSPDSQTVYVGSHYYLSAGVATFTWSGGELVQLAGPAGCISAYPWYSGQDCADGHGMYYLEDLAVSADGETVYASGNDYLAVLKRDGGAGGLTQSPGTDGCLASSAGDGCADARALSGATSVELVGDEVYVASQYSDAVAVFDAAADGTLTQPAGVDGCIDQQGDEDCLDGRGLDAARGLAASPDGRTLYAASRDSDAVAILDRRADGSLRQARNDRGCWSTNGRDPQSGATYRCSAARGLQDADAVAVSPDGANVYVVGDYDDAIAAFKREPDGDLRRLAGADHCTSDDGDVGESAYYYYNYHQIGVCRTTGNAAELLDGEAGIAGVSISPDGANVYVAAANATSGAGGDGALSVWSRTPVTPPSQPDRLVWDLGEDFALGADRGEDDHGNDGVWEYKSAATTDGAGRDPSAYAVLAHEADANLVRRSAGGYPSITRRARGSVTTHPDTTVATVIEWTNPLGRAATVGVDLQVSDENAGGGNGVRWYLDQGTSADTTATNVAQGDIPNGDDADRYEDDVALAAGESLYVVVAPKSSDNSYDSTGVDLRVTGPVEGGPQTIITDAPSGTVATRTPEIAFTSNVGGATFECETHKAGDPAGAWEDCTSPHELDLPSDGDWVVRVRADDGSLTDPTPARRRFTVDTTAPVITVTNGPGASTRDDSPRFEWTLSEPGRVECRLDDAAFAKCVSPQDYADLADGPHTFDLRATDDHGNVSAVLTRGFTVNTDPAGGQPGALSQLPGTAGCIANSTPPYNGDVCGQGRRIAGAIGSTFSPGAGEQLYVAAFDDDTVTVYDRDTSTGALTQRAGAAGCLAANTDANCQGPIAALDGAASIVTGDETIYVAGYHANSIAVLHRNADGSLEPLAGAPCVGAAAGCEPARQLSNPAALAITPDGERLYVANEGSDAITVFAIAADGALTQLAGTDGCTSNTGSGGACRDARALQNPVGAAISPDGTNLYVGSSESHSVTTFAIKDDGHLRQLNGERGCIRETAGEDCVDGLALTYARDLQVSPDGGQVYVAANDGLAVLDRRGVDGSLTMSGARDQCVWNYNTPDCRLGRGMDAEGQSLAVAPDGGNVYIQDPHYDSLATLRRDAEGDLRQLAGRDGCMYEGGANGACRDGRGLRSTYGVDSIVVSPDNRFVYFTGRDHPGTIAVFRRNVPTALHVSPPTEWDAFEDFNQTAPGTNPGADRYGNAGVWEYLKVAADNDATDRFSATYTPLDQFRGGNYRRSGWFDSTSPAGYLGAGVADAEDRFYMHPERDADGNESAVTRWTNPLAGSNQFRVQGLLEDEYAGNDGVRWYLDRLVAGTRTNIASGTLPAGGRAQEIDETLTLGAGHSLELVLAPRGDYDNDSTWVDLHITGPQEAGPQTVLQSAPRGRIADPTPTASFASPTGTAFECSIDGGAWTACASGDPLPSQTDATHTFAVRATDGAAVDPSPARSRFTVDTSTPEVSILSGPTGTTRDPASTFTFSATEPGVIECRIDETGNPDPDSWIGCPSPYQTPELADGSHTLEVRAVDRAGNISAVKSRTFSVDTGAASLQPGALSQLPGERGCVSETPLTDNCAQGRRTDATTAGAMSADGKFLYTVAYEGDTLSVYARDTGQGGKLAPVAGEGGCVTDADVDSCANGRAMNGPHAVAVYEDNVYVAGTDNDTVLAFDRDPVTGEVEQLPGTDGCVRNGAETADCAAGHALDSPVYMTVSPDGKNVYVSTDGNGGAVSVLDRDPVTGALSQDPGVDGCFSHDGRDGCRDARSLNQGEDLVVAPDGGHVYQASYYGHSVITYERDADGDLTQPVGEAGCINQNGEEGCADGRNLNWALGLAISPDGRTVYSTHDDTGGIGILEVQPDGGLRSLDGQAACLRSSDSNGCTVVSGTDHPTAAMVSPDGGNLYVTARDANAVTAFSIDEQDGTLRQLSGADACVSQTGSGGRCRDGKALNIYYGHNLVGSPDGANVYVMARESDAVAAFARKPVKGNGDDPADMRWDLAADFRLQPDNANPQPDRYDNADVWSFRQDAAAAADGADRAPANYTVLPQLRTDEAFGTAYPQQYWARNTGGGDQRYPFAGRSRFGRFSVHPYTAAPGNSVVGWTNPTGGPLTVNVSGLFQKVEPNHGDGIRWYVDREGDNLRSGEINPGGAGQNFDFTETVGAGETLWFYVARKGSDTYDGTYIDAVISGVDETGPQTRITGGPGAVTRDTTPAFTFTSPTAGATFECRVDGNAWAACASGDELSSLADGAHVFRVRAVDGADKDPSPSRRAFRVDTTVPSVVLDAGPEGLTRDRTPTYEFSPSTAEAGVYFECKLDAGAFERCTSPYTTPELVNGDHAVTIRARDRAGNESAPVAIDLTVDLSPAGLQFGGLTQLPGTDGCITETGTGGQCADGHGLDGAASTAITPDGKTVYAGSAEGNAITAYTRAGSGALTEVDCVNSAGTDGCADGRALDRIESLQVSADGRFLYAASRDAHAVLVFTIDPATGAIEQLAGTDGCISRTGSGADGCASTGSQALNGPFDLAFAGADQRFLLSADHDGSTVTTLDRDPDTGALAYNSCIRHNSTAEGCGSVRMLSGPLSIEAVGDDVYVGSYYSNGISVLKRSAGGVLTQPAGADGCLYYSGTSDGCAAGRRMAYPYDLALSPDGKQLYVADDYEDAISVLDRDPATGLLTQSPTADGCWDNDGNGNDGNCRRAAGLYDVRGIAMAPDGRTVYGLSATDNALTIFKRDRTSGDLQQLSGVDGCWSNSGTDGECRDGKALDAHGQHALVVSPDGANVYAGTYDSDGIAAFARRVPRADNLPPLREWNLAEDFDTTAGATNPQQDRNGNTGVWEFLRGNGGQDASTRDRTTYAPFARKQTNGDWLQLWDRADGDGSDYPYVGLLRSGRVHVHPDNGADGEPAVVRWTYPYAESVTLDVSLRFRYTSCGGDGVRWFLDKNGTQLRSGRLVNATGSRTAQIDRSIAVEPGDVLEVGIANRTGGYSCDGTDISWQMTSGPVIDTDFTAASPGNGDFVADRTPTFEAVSEPGATFFCRVTQGSTGSGAFTACDQPFTTDELADGTWTVEAYARVGGTDDPTPARRTFVVDGTAPEPVVTAPADGSATSDTTPAISGTAGTEAASADASQDVAAVTVRVWAGTTATGEPVRTATNVPVIAGGWTTTIGTALPEGAYTARAIQQDGAGNSGPSAPVTFRVDTTKPTIAISSPAQQNPIVDINQQRPTVTGVAGSADGTGEASRDGDTLTITIYAGNTTATELAQWTTARAADGSFSSQMPGTFPELTDGQYNVRVTQTDAAGNTETFPAGNGRQFKVDTIAPTVTATSPPATTRDRAPAFVGTAGIADAQTTRSADSTTVTLKVYSGTTATGQLAVPAVDGTRASNGAFTLAPGEDLADGTYTGVVEQSDNAGNVGRSTPRTFKVDRTGPAITIGAPPADTGDDTPGIAGQGGFLDGGAADSVADDGTIDIEVHAGTTTGGTPLQTLADVPNDQLAGGFNGVPAALDDGTYTARVTQADALGNTTSQTRTFKVDTVDPAGLALTQPADGAMLQTARPTFSGAAASEDGTHPERSADDALVIVEIRPFGQPATTPVIVMADRTGGTWSAQVPGADALADGRYEAFARQRDGALNEAETPTISFKIDNTAPQPTIATAGGRTDWDETLVSFTGVGGTNTASDVQSTDLDPITVKVYAGTTVGGSPAATKTVSRAVDGAYSATLDDQLAPGRYVAVAEQSDGAGNTGQSATPVAFKVDKADPDVSVTVPAEKQAFNDRTPDFSGGKGNEDGTAATQSADTDAVELRITAAGGFDRSWTQASTTATWATTVPGADLDEGYYTLTARQTDAAGNAGTTADRHFKIDLTAPAATIADPGGDINTSPTLTGTAGTNDGQGTGSQGADEDQVSVAVYRYTGATRALVKTLDATVGAAGAWSVPAALGTDGRYEVEVTQADAAGNEATSAPQAFRLDTEAPSITLTAPDGDTNDRKPHLVGTAGTNAGGPSSDTSADGTQLTVRVTRGADTVLPNTDVAIGGTGAFDVAIPAPGAGLDAGTYVVHLTQTDGAGNSSASATKTFKVDFTKPQGLTAATPADGARTKDTTPAFTGTNGTEDGAAEDRSADGAVTIRIWEATADPATDAPLRSFDATRTAGTYTGSPAAALAQGAYQWTASQSDAAGNGDSTAPRGFVIDTTAPTPTITSPSADYTGTRDVTIGGARGSAPGDENPVTVTLTRGGTPVGGALTDGGNGANWSVLAEDLADGTYVATVSQDDAAGNTGTAQLTFKVDATSPAVTVAPVAPSNGATLPTITGTAGNASASATTAADKAAVEVEIEPLSGGTAAFSRTTNRSAGTWSLTDATALAEGRYRATASQGDEAAPSNVGTSTPREFVVDRTAPAPTITAPAAGARKDGSFTVTAQLATADGAGAASADQNSGVVRVFAGDVPADSDPATAVDSEPLTGNGQGVASAAVAFTGPDGDYTISVRQQDAAGNVGYAKRVVTVDATPPTVTIDPIPARIATALPQLEGDAGTAARDLAAVTVDLTGPGGQTRTLDAAVTGGRWTATPGTALANGQWTARARQSDAPGNEGESAQRTFTVDTVAPGLTITSPADGAWTKDRTPAVTGTAGTAAGDLGTVRVTFDGAGPDVVVDAAVGAGGAFSATPPADLAEGTYQLTARQLDDVDNATTAGPRTLRIDVTAPAVTMEAVPSPRNTVPTLKGDAGTAAGDDGTVRVRVSGSSVDEEIDVVAGKWELALPAGLADGEHTATVTQDDAADNQGSAQRTFVLDRTAPAPTVAAPAGDVNVKRPPLSGTAGAAATDDATLAIAVTRDGGPTTTTTVTRTGAAWTLTPASDLADGRYTATATQGDAAGNTATSPARAFRVDTAAPAVTLAAVAAEGNDPTPTFTGANGGADGNGVPSQDGAVTVRIHTGTSTAGALVQTVNATRTLNAYTGTATTLPDGTYTAVARQTDGAGNQGESAPRTFKIDTAAPAVTLTTPADGLRTNDTTPAFAGAAGDLAATAARSADATGVRVRVYDNAGLDGAPVATYTTSRTAAAWSLDAAPALAEGEYWARADQADGAGNTGTSATRRFVVDATPPQLAVTAPDDGTWVKTGRPVVSGTTSDGTDVTVTFTRDATTRTRTVAPQDGAFSAQLEAADALGDGTWTVTAAQTDAAGNNRTTAPRTVRIDTAAPAVTLADPPTRTADATPTLTGAAGTAAGDGPVTVDLAGPGGATRTLDGTVTGGEWTATPDAALADGGWTATARQSDAAGNDASSAAKPFTVDTTAPQLTITEPADDTVTKDTTPTIAGTAGTAAGDAATVRITLDGPGADVTVDAPVGAGGAYSATAPELAEGDYAITARQRDDLDNAATAGPRALRVDTAGPGVTITAPAEGARLTDTTPTFTGQAGTGAGDADEVRLKLYAGGAATGTPAQTRTASVDSDGAWSVDASPALAVGAYTAVAEQADNAGNTAASAPRTFSVAAPVQVTPTPVPPTPTPVVDAPPQIAALKGALKAKAAAKALFGKGHFAASLQLSEASRVEGFLLLPARTARKLRIKGAAQVVGTRRMVVIGRSKPLQAAGAATLRLKVAKATRRKLARARRLTLTVLVSATDAAGQATQQTLTVRLKRPPAKRRK